MENTTIYWVELESGKLYLDFLDLNLYGLHSEMKRFTLLSDFSYCQLGVF